MVKLCCGVANNAAWIVSLDAYDKVKHHKMFNQRLNGGHTLKSYYKKAIDEFHKYERQLLYARQNRLFHVADMGEEVRKRYGAISDREYYELWAGMGSMAYQRTKPLITSLANKYRLSLLQHDIEQADIVAWCMTAQACLSLAVKVHEHSVASVTDNVILTPRVCERFFRQLSLKTVSKLWMDALQATEPRTDTYELEHTEERNIEMGLEQLHEAWVSIDTLYKSLTDTVSEYDEVFRTRGEQKKALREIIELESYTYDEYNDETTSAT